MILWFKSVLNTAQVDTWQTSHFLYNVFVLSFSCFFCIIQSSFKTAYGFSSVSSDNEGALNASISWNELRQQQSQGMWYQMGWGRWWRFNFERFHCKDLTRWFMQFVQSTVLYLVCLCVWLIVESVSPKGSVAAFGTGWFKIYYMPQE